jgi:hypothetical protein
LGQKISTALLALLLSSPALADELPQGSIDFGFHWRPPVAPADFGGTLPSFDMSAYGVWGMDSGDLQLYLRADGVNPITAIPAFTYLILADSNDPVIASMFALNITGPAPFFGLELGPMLNFGSFGVGVGVDLSARTVPVIRGTTADTFILGGDVGGNLFVLYSLGERMVLESGARVGYAGSSDPSRMIVVDTHAYLRHGLLDGYSEQGLGYLAGVGTQSFLGVDDNPNFSQTHIDLRIGITY